MSTLTAEKFPIYGRADDWAEALSKTDFDSWSRARSRRIFTPTSSTARIAEGDIVWAFSAPSLHLPLSGEITWTPEIKSPDLTARILRRLLIDRVATKHIIVNIGNVLSSRRHLEERMRVSRG